MRRAGTCAQGPTPAQRRRLLRLLDKGVAYDDGRYGAREAGLDEAVRRLAAAQIGAGTAGRKPADPQAGRAGDQATRQSKSNKQAKTEERE